MDIGSLTVEVVTDSKGRRLRVQGRVYGVETDVTREDLERLSRYCAAEAQKLRDEKKEETR